MNLANIRNAVFAQADWAPTQSAEAIARLNVFINRAYSQIALEAPFGFFETQVQFATQPDVEPVGATDTISVVTVNDVLPTPGRNPWVFEATLAIGAAGATAWAVDRSWDGRMIEITTGGETYRNRIRTIWTMADGISVRFSVEKPWDYAALGYGPFASWRIYTDAYYLPDDVIAVKSMRLFAASENWPIDIVGQFEAEDMSLADRRSVVATGPPRTAYRRGHFQLPAPTMAPVVTVVDGDSDKGAPTPVWLGPEPPGTFQYVFTYCWGKRDIQFRNPNSAEWQGYAPNYQNTSVAGFSATTNAYHRHREPLWESAPSPISGVATAVLVAGIGDPPAFTSLGFILGFPNIEYMQGFFSVGTDQPSGAFARQNIPQSGWYIRIYRRRLTADFSGYQFQGLIAGTTGIADLTNIESPDAYFLLTELNIDTSNDAVWADRGEVIPDYSRRLRDVHGYQGLAFYPNAGQRYEVDVRCVRRPSELADDQDAPLVHAEAVEAIIARALIFLREAEGASDLAASAWAQYERAMANLTKRYGSLLPPSRPVTRRLARARSGFSQHGNLRRWYTL